MKLTLIPRENERWGHVVCLMSARELHLHSRAWCNRSIGAGTRQEQRQHVRRQVSRRPKNRHRANRRRLVTPQRSRVRPSMEGANAHTTPCEGLHTFGALAAPNSGTQLNDYLMCGMLRSAPVLFLAVAKASMLSLPTGETLLRLPRTDARAVRRFWYPTNTRAAHVSFDWRFTLHHVTEKAVSDSPL